VDDKDGLTVALDTPSARVLADQASVIQDLQFVMDCCLRLLTELGRPEDERDGIVPLALWSSAVTAYGRCFAPGGRAGLTADDVQRLPLQGAVSSFHDWVMGQRDRLAAPGPDPFEGARVGAVLHPAGRNGRPVEGIAVFATGRVVVDGTGVRQLGGLASELAKQTAVAGTKQQDAVLAEAGKLDRDTLYALPPLRTEPAAAPAAPAPAPAAPAAEKG
jgi:hypothetical protein